MKRLGVVISAEPDVIDITFFTISGNRRTYSYKVNKQKTAAFLMLRTHVSKLFMISVVKNVSSEKFLKEATCDSIDGNTLGFYKLTGYTKQFIFNKKGDTTFSEFLDK